jgi:hypothetical protein
LEGKAKPIIWTKQAIQKLQTKIKKGLEFFVGHNSDNSKQGRSKVGSIIDSFLDTVDGKLSNIIVGHFPNPKSVEQMDMDSMEADLELYEYGDTYIVNDVQDLTAVALGSSDEQSPGFIGAKRLAMIQCFTDSKIKENFSGEEKKMALEYSQLKAEVTLDQIKQLITDRQIHPNQLFNENSIKEDRIFGKLLETLTEENKTLKKEKETFDTKLKEAGKKNERIEAKEKLDTFFPEGTTDTIKTFITKRFNKVELDNYEDDSIKKFIEDQQKEFQEFAKLTGSSESKNDDSDMSTESQDGDPVEDTLKEIV